MPYLIEIEDWRAPYTFGISRIADEGGDPFTEYRTIEFSGGIIVPDLPKTKKAEILVWPETYLNPAGRTRAEPTAVGHASSSAGVLRCHLFLPAEMYLPLISVSAAQKVRYLNFGGDKLRYGNANIRSYTFDHDAPPDHVKELQEIWAAEAKSRRDASRKKAK
ncbi:MAG TPA: hypothetical protein VGN60_01250 [Devosia sp.]|nr:hypothetical protein [Devosia sp.]